MEKLDTSVNGKQFMQRQLVGDFVYCEAQGDFTLPDYLPEIRKIVRIDTTVIPSGKFIASNRAEFAGIVAYNLVYSDSEGKLASTSLSSDYEFSVPMPSEAGECCVVCDSMAESTQCRPIGPRKLSLRSSVKSSVHIYCSSAVECITDGELCLETLERPYSVMNTKCATSGEFTLSDIIDMDGYSPDTLRVNFTSADVVVREAHMQDGVVVCRGEAHVKCNVSPATGVPFTVTKKIPFEQIVPVSAHDECHCVAYGRCCFVNCSLEEAEQTCRIRVELGAELDVECMGNSAVTLVEDAYSTECKAIPSYKNAVFSTFVGCAMGNYSVGANRVRGADEDGIMTVIDTSASSSVKSISEKDGRAVIHGECRTETLVCRVVNDGESTEYMSCPYTFPFKLETDLRVGNDENIEYDCHVSTVMARARIEDDALFVDAELFTALRASKKQSVRTLDGVELDREDTLPDRIGKIVICYPDDGETLFSVAKKYRVGYRRLAEQNDIPDTLSATPNEAITLDGISHLIIPRS